jgi:hypothetical protein
LLGLGATSTAFPLRAGRVGEGPDRIRIDRTHIAGSIDPVNPVYTYKVEQIHAADGIADGDSNQPRSALARVLINGSAAALHLRTSAIR